MIKSISVHTNRLVILAVFVLSSFACLAQSGPPTYEYAVLIIPVNSLGGKATNNYVFMSPDGSTTIIGPKEMANPILDNGYMKTFNNGVYNSLLIINEYAAKGWEYVENAGTQIIFRRRK